MECLTGYLTTSSFWCALVQTALLFSERHVVLHWLTGLLKTHFPRFLDNTFQRNPTETCQYFKINFVDVYVSNSLTFSNWEKSCWEKMLFCGTIIIIINNTYPLLATELCWSKWRITRGESQKVCPTTDLNKLIPKARTCQAMFRPKIALHSNK